MEPYKKIDKTKAVLGTIIFHLLLLLLLLFSALRTPLPLPEEEGVLIAIGHTDYGIGERPPQTSPPPTPSTTPESQAAADDVATQTTEETIAMPEATEETDTRPEPDPTPQPTQPDPQPQVDDEPEEEPEPEVDERALFPGRDSRSDEDESRGDTGDPGFQGRPDGHADGEATEGGGIGEGVEFSLSGRKANYLPIPDYTTAAQGRVVVSITVNRNGQVTRASAGARGTTTTDRTLWRLAEDAAKKARFDIKQDAPEEQTGTITYNFIRIN